MKKNILGIVLFTLLFAGLSFVPQTAAQQCATFDFVTNTFRVPCFNLGEQSYWLDMGFSRSTSPTLEIKNFGLKGAESADPDCASVDFSTLNFHVPCSYILGGNYWIDFLVDMTSLEFTVQGSGENAGNPAPGY